MNENTSINYVVCENIRSAYNVGNIIRTADALGRGVIIAGYSAPITHKKVKKAALGAEESVPIIHFQNIQHYRNRLIDQKYTIIAAEHTDDSQPLYQAKNTISKPLALVMGNEILGVTEETLAIANHIYHIPMLGTKESLNVGQAAAIFMREFRN